MITAYVVKRQSNTNTVARPPKPKLDPTQCRYCKQHYTVKGLPRHQKACKEKHHD